MRVARTIVLASALALPARAQTWAGGAADPVLLDLVAVDMTGELSPDFPVDWPFGFEDLAGNGVEFRAQEQAVDIRELYGALDGTTLWLRVYVSDATGPSANIDVYFFLDTDLDPTTGGPADPVQIDPELTPYPAGGFEYVLHAQGNAAVALWEWNDAAELYVLRAPDTYTADGEVGASIDPILINGDEHGYVQASLEIDDIGLAAGDSLWAFVRTWNPSGMPGTGFGDTEIGEPGPVPPGDSDGDGLPDPIDPGGCTSSARCPGGYVCINDDCVPCASDEDCEDWQVCDDGSCVAEPCDSDDDCGDGTCVEGVCVPPVGEGESESEAEAEAEAESESEGEECTTHEDCGANLFCHPEDRMCVDYVAPDGGAVQGGACTCRTGAAPAGGSERSERALVALLGLALALVFRRKP